MIFVFYKELYNVLKLIYTNMAPFTFVYRTADIYLCGS